MELGNALGARGEGGMGSEGVNVLTGACMASGAGRLPADRLAGTLVVAAALAGDLEVSTGSFRADTGPALGGFGATGAAFRAGTAARLDGFVAARGAGLDTGTTAGFAAGLAAAFDGGFGTGLAACLTVERRMDSWSGRADTPEAFIPQPHSSIRPRRPLRSRRTLATASAVPPADYDAAADHSLGTNQKR